LNEIVQVLFFTSTIVNNPSSSLMMLHSFLSLTLSCKEYVPVNITFSSPARIFSFLFVHSIDKDSLLLGFLLQLVKVDDAIPPPIRATVLVPVNKVLSKIFLFI
jgi:hypothetical protein